MAFIIRGTTRVLSSSKISLVCGRVLLQPLRKYRQHSNSKIGHSRTGPIQSNGPLLCSNYYMPISSRSKTTWDNIENDILNNVKSKGKDDVLRGLLGDASERNEAVFRKVRPGRSLDHLRHLDYLGREIVQEHAHLFLPLQETQLWVDEVKATLIGRSPPEEKIKAAVRKADELAVNVILMKETFDRLPAEEKERKKLAGTLILKNLKITSSMDAAPQDHHDRNEVDQYFRFLGQRTVFISRIERCLVNRKEALAVTVREQMAKKLLMNYTEIGAHGSGVQMTSSYTPLQKEFRGLLVKEMIIRNIVSKARSDPFYWVMDSRVHRRPIKGTYRRNDTEREFKNYTLDVLERTVDEFVESRAFFSEVDATDYHHLQHKKLKDLDILLMNVKMSPDSPHQEFEQVNSDVERVQDLFRYLGVPPYFIREIRATTSKHQKSPGIIVRLANREAKLSVLRRAKDLRRAPYHWMNEVFIRPSHTLLQQYMDSLKVQEVKARNEILERKNQPGKWLLRSGDVQFDDSYSKPFITPKKVESDLA